MRRTSPEHHRPIAALYTTVISETLRWPGPGVRHMKCGLAIQMHFIPYYAPGIAELARTLPEMPVILDHLGRPAQGSPAEFDNVLRLADLPRVYMKYSNISAASKEKFPYSDVKPIVRRAYQAFGPDRMLWGYLGTTLPEYKASEELFGMMFDFAPESERIKIRSLNAKKLFAFD